MKKPKVVRWLIAAAISGGTLAGLSMGLVACSSGSQATPISNNNSGTTGLQNLSSIATKLDNVLQSKTPDGKELDGYSMSLFQGRFYAAILPYLFFSVDAANPLQASASVGREQLNVVMMKAFGLDISTATGDELNSANERLRSYLTPLQNMITRVAASITSSPMTLNAFFDNTDSVNPVLRMTITQAPSLTYRVLQVAQAVMSYFGMNTQGQVNAAVTNVGIRQQLGVYTDEVVQKDYYQWEAGAKREADAVFAQVIATQLAGFTPWSAVQYSQNLQTATNGQVVRGFVTARFTGAGTYGEPANDTNYQNGLLTYSTNFLVHSTSVTNPTAPSKPSDQPTDPMRPADQFSAVTTAVDNDQPTYKNTRSFPTDKVVPPVIAEAGYVIPANYEWRDASGKELGVEGFLSLKDKDMFFAVWTISPRESTTGMPYTYSQRFVIARTPAASEATDQTASEVIEVDNEARKTLPSDLLTAPTAASGYVANGAYAWIDENGDILTQSKYVALQDKARFSAVWTFIRSDGQPGSYRYTQPLVVALAPLKVPASDSSGRVYAVDNTVKRSFPTNLLVPPAPAAGYELDGTYAWKDASGNALTEEAYRNLADGTAFSAVWTFKRSSGREASYTYTQRFVIAWPAITIPADQQSKDVISVNNTKTTALPDALLDPPLPADGFVLGQPVWQNEAGSALTDAAFGKLADGTSFKAVWTMTRSDGRAGSYKYTQRFVVDQDAIEIPADQTAGEIVSVNNKQRSTLPNELLTEPTPAEGFVVSGTHVWLDNGGGAINDAKFALLPNGIGFKAVWTMTRADGKDGSYTFSQKFLVVQVPSVAPADQISDSVVSVDNKRLATLPVASLVRPPVVTGYEILGSSWQDSAGRSLDDASFRALADGTAFVALWQLVKSDDHSVRYTYRQRFVVTQAPVVAPASQTSATSTEVDNLTDSSLPISKIVPPTALPSYYVTGPYVWQDNNGRTLTPSLYAQLPDGATFSAVWNFVRTDGRPGSYTYTQSFVVKQPAVQTPAPSLPDEPVAGIPIGQQVLNLMSGMTKDGTKPLDGYTLSLLKGNFYASALPYLQLSDRLDVTLNKVALIAILAKTTKLPVSGLTNEELIALQDPINKMLEVLVPILGALSAVGVTGAGLQQNMSVVDGAAQSVIKITNVPGDKIASVRDLLSGILGKSDAPASYYDEVVQNNLGFLTDGTLTKVVPADDKVAANIKAAMEVIKGKQLTGFSPWSEVTFDNDPEVAPYGTLITAKITANYVGGDGYQAIRADQRYANGKLTYYMKVYVGAEEVVDNTALITSIKNELAGLTADGKQQRDGYYLSTRAANVVLDWFSAVKYDAAGGYALGKSTIQTIIKDATGLDASGLTDDDLVSLASSLTNYLSFIRDRVKKLNGGSISMTMVLQLNASKKAQLSGVVSAASAEQLDSVLKTLADEAFAPSLAIQTAYGKISADPLTIRLKTSDNQQAATDAAMAAVKAGRLAGFGEWSSITYSSPPDQATNGDTITATMTADYLSLTGFADPVMSGRFADYRVTYTVTFAFYSSDTANPQDNTQVLASLRAFFTNRDAQSDKPYNGYVASQHNGNFLVNLIPAFKIDDTGGFLVPRASLNTLIRQTTGIDPSSLTEDEMLSLSSSIAAFMQPLHDMMPAAGKALSMTIDFTFALSKGADGKANISGGLQISAPSRMGEVVKALNVLLTGGEPYVTVQSTLGLMADGDISQRVVNNTALATATAGAFDSIKGKQLAGYGPWSQVGYSKPLATAQPGDVIYGSISADYTGGDAYAPVTVGGRVKEGSKVVYAIKFIITNADGTTTAPVDHQLLLAQLKRGITGFDPVTGLQQDGYTKSLHRGRFELLWMPNFRLSSDGSYQIEKPVLLAMLKALTGLDASPLTDAELVELNGSFNVMIADKLALVTSEAEREGHGTTHVTLSADIKIGQTGSAVISGKLTATSFLDVAVSQASSRSAAEAEQASQNIQTGYGFMTDDTLTYTVPVGAQKSSLDGIFAAIAGKTLDRFSAWSAPSYSINPATAKDGDVITGTITATYLGENSSYQPLAADYRINGNTLTYSIVFRVVASATAVTGANSAQNTVAYALNFLNGKDAFTGRSLDGYRLSLFKGELIKALVPLMNWGDDGIFHISKEQFATVFVNIAKVNLRSLADADWQRISSVLAAYLSPLSDIGGIAGQTTGAATNLVVSVARNEITDELELQGRISIADPTKLPLALNVVKLTLGSDSDSSAALDGKIQHNLGLFTNGTMALEVSKSNLNSPYFASLLAKLVGKRIEGFSDWQEPVFSKALSSLANGDTFTVTYSANYQGDSAYGPLPPGGRINNGVLVFSVSFNVVEHASSVGDANQLILKQLEDFFAGRDPSTGLLVNGYVLSNRLGLALNEWVKNAVLDATGTFSLDREQLNQMVARVSGIDVSFLTGAELLSLNDSFARFFGVIADFVKSTSKGEVTLKLDLALNSRNEAALTGVLQGTPDKLAAIAASQRKAASDPATPIQVQAGYFSPQTLAVKVRYNANTAVMQADVEALFAAIRARQLDRFGAWSAISFDQPLSAARPGSRLVGKTEATYLGDASGYLKATASGFFNGSKVVYQVVISVVGASDTVEITSNDILGRISNVLRGLDPVTGKQLDGYTSSLQRGTALKYLFTFATVAGDATITINKNDLLNMIKAGTGIDANTLTDDQLVSLEGPMQAFFAPLVDYVQSISVAGITPKVRISVAKNSIGQATGTVSISASAAVDVTSTIASLAGGVLADFRASPDSNIQQVLGIFTSETVTIRLAVSPKPDVFTAVLKAMKPIIAKQLNGFGAWSAISTSSDISSPKNGDIYVYKTEAVFLNDSSIQPYAPSGRLKEGKVEYTVNVLIGSAASTGDSGDYDPYKSMLSVLNGVDYKSGRKIDGYTRGLIKGSVRSWLITNFESKLSSNAILATIFRTPLIGIEEPQLRDLITTVTGYSASLLTSAQVATLINMLLPEIYTFFGWLVDNLPYDGSATVNGYSLDLYGPGGFGLPDGQKAVLTGEFHLNFLIWPFTFLYNTAREVSTLLGKYRHEKLSDYMFNQLHWMYAANLELYITKPRTMDEIRQPIVRSVAWIQSAVLDGFGPWSDLKINLPSGKTFRDVVKGDRITAVMTAKWDDSSDTTYLRPQESNRFRGDTLTFTVELYVI